MYYCVLGALPRNLACLLRSSQYLEVLRGWGGEGGDGVCGKEIREGVGAGGRNDPSIVCTYE
jgi:hypothetical protein